MVSRRALLAVVFGSIKSRLFDREGTFQLRSRIPPTSISIYDNVLVELTFSDAKLNNQILVGPTLSTFFLTRSQMSLKSIRVFRYEHDDLPRAILLGDTSMMIDLLPVHPDTSHPVLTVSGKRSVLADILPEWPVHISNPNDDVVLVVVGIPDTLRRKDGLIPGLSYDGVLVSSNEVSGPWSRSLLSALASPVTMACVRRQPAKDQ